jgi:hypothetical protein
MEAGAPGIIETDWGRGYILKGHVAIADAAAA